MFGNKPVKVVVLGLVLLLTGIVTTFGAGWSRVKPAGPYCTSNCVLVLVQNIGVVVAVINAVVTPSTVGAIHFSTILTSSINHRSPLVASAGCVNTFTKAK